MLIFKTREFYVVVEEGKNKRDKNLKNKTK